METKKIIVAFLLLSVFTVGTLSFADTVEAAKWKKFSSGNFKDKKMSYVSYSKGTKEIKMDTYVKLKGKKTKVASLFFTKTGSNIKSYSVDYKGKKSKVTTTAYKGNAKQYYNNYISFLKKQKIL